MDGTNDWNDPWLVAVWPGMGAIAQIAGAHLVASLGAELVAELPPDGHFDVRSIRVGGGIVAPAPLPRSRFFGWHNPGDGPDLIVLLGEQQPAQGGYRYCEELLDVAARFGVTRVVTFAAMASPIRPENEPRVLAGATSPEILEELEGAPIEPLADGEISGLNGVIVAAAAARGLGGLCLLGEFPFFANAIAHPKASAAVLRRFARLAGIEIDLTRLDAQAVEVERALVDHLEQLERAMRRASGRTEDEPSFPQPEEREPEDELHPAARARIESLFERAAQDRSVAMELKSELDRHGVFDDYEDRFLDLFKQAE